MVFELEILDRINPLADARVLRLISRSDKFNSRTGESFRSWETTWRKRSVKIISNRTYRGAYILFINSKTESLGSLKQIAFIILFLVLRVLVWYFSEVLPWTRTPYGIMFLQILRKRHKNVSSVFVMNIFVGKLSWEKITNNKKLWQSISWKLRRHMFSS